jgi:hypothetical protein
MWAIEVNRLYLNIRQYGRGGSPEPPALYLPTKIKTPVIRAKTPMTIEPMPT